MLTMAMAMVVLSVLLTADGDEHNITGSTTLATTASTIFGHLCYSEALAGAGLSWKDTRSRDGFLESATGDQLRDGSLRHEWTLGIGDGFRGAVCCEAAYELQGLRL